MATKFKGLILQKGNINVSLESRIMSVTCSLALLLRGECGLFPKHAIYRDGNSLRVNDHCANRNPTFIQQASLP